MTSPESPTTPEPPVAPDAPEPSAEPQPTPQPPVQSPGSDSGLRAPRGCAEWAVVILGVIWIVLAIVFVIALIVRLAA